MEPTDGYLSTAHSFERLDSHLDVQLGRKRADSMSVITVDTADLDGQLTRPDQDQMDRMIEEETSQTGRVTYLYFIVQFSYPGFIHVCSYTAQVIRVPWVRTLLSIHIISVTFEENHSKYSRLPITRTSKGN